jgi:predicted RNA methylase
MDGFEAAIAHAVAPGARVLELGGGTGVLSFFAARKASKVYCVERIGENAAAARKFLAGNGVADRVSVIEADADGYLPPEPVDVVICEMLHSAMLREKQIPLIDAFKQRYRARFGERLPIFVPEALIMGVQAVEQRFDFNGYCAPVPMFSAWSDPRTRELSPPIVYATFAYDEPYPRRFGLDQQILIESSGTVNALRFITKNLLAILPREGRAIEWNMQHLILPLSEPVAVEAHQRVRVRFEYEGGEGLNALIDSMSVEAKR